MEKNLKQICRDIKKGDNLESSIPIFFSKLSSTYEQYAEIKLTLLYYTFYEMYFDEEQQVYSEEQKNYVNELNTIIKDCFSEHFSGERMEKNIQQIDILRNKIIKQMNVLTAYTDIFQNYEYILNRVEYRFQNHIEEIDEEEILEEIMRYIFESKDNAIINARIKEVISELPIRITKSKYYDMLRDSLSVYNGAEISSLETYLYMIKSSAMLYKPEGFDTEYPELILLMNRLEACEIKNITEEEYNNFTSSLEKAGNTLKSSIDYYYALQEIVNLVYAINLLTPYAYMETDAQFDDDQYKMVIKEINKHFNDNHISQISEDIMDKLVQTEGIQEELLEKMDDLESCLYKIETNYMNLVESLMLKSTFHCLDTATNLIGNSLFIDLTSAENHDKADKKYIETKQDELICLFTEFFTGKSKEIYRAVVANTINKMPLFFQSSNDVMDYVRNSLEQCRDVAEKKACIDMIKNFWEI